MAYSDVLTATSMYGNLLGNQYANAANNINMADLTTSVNPYSSGAYTTSARNIYGGTGRSNISKMELLRQQRENQSSLDRGLMSLGRGMQFQKFGTGLNPSLQKLGTNIAQASLGSGATLPKGFATQASGFNIGPAAMIYGMTRDNNPYSYSTTERLGGLATGASLMGNLSKLIPAGKFSAATGSSVLGMNPYMLGAGLLLGGLFNRKQKKKASRLRSKEKERIQNIQSDVYADREQKVKEAREEMLAQQSRQMYDTQADRYTNQYGGNITAEDGMKMSKDIVAEFTGNELVVNDQNALEVDLARGDNKSAANRIRKAIKGGKITPGKETHKGNPIPVAKDGTIYAKGGPLAFKVKEGAGVYDHATDQFKDGMDDDTIVKIVRKNMKKWRKNNMA